MVQRRRCAVREGTPVWRANCCLLGRGVAFSEGPPWWPPASFIQLALKVYLLPMLASLLLYGIPFTVYLLYVPSGNTVGNTY